MDIGLIIDGQTLAHVLTHSSSTSKRWCRYDELSIIRWISYDDNVVVSGSLYNRAYRCVPRRRSQFVNVDNGEVPLDLLFLQLACLCRSVVCCRTTPSQKGMQLYLIWKFLPRQPLYVNQFSFRSGGSTGQRQLGRFDIGYWGWRQRCSHDPLGRRWYWHFRSVFASVILTCLP